MENQKEEIYEKCRALLKVADVGLIDENDRKTVIWAARDYYEKLGEIIGISKKK